MIYPDPLDRIIYSDHIHHMIRTLVVFLFPPLCVLDDLCIQSDAANLYLFILRTAASQHRCLATPPSLYVIHP